jgi:hypothetical protein
MINGGAQESLPSFASYGQLTSSGQSDVWAPGASHPALIPPYFHYGFSILEPELIANQSLAPSAPLILSKMLSSPPRPPQSTKSIKTSQIKVENNRRTSFGQFGKIEVEGNNSRPGY